MEQQNQKKQRKLNREDHKGEEKVAQGIRGVVIGVALATPAAMYIKKNGVNALKSVPKMVAKIIFRKF